MKGNAEDGSGINEKPLLILYNWLRSEIESRCHEGFGTLETKIESYREKLKKSQFIIAKVPQQVEMSDCGIFVLKFAQCICQGKIINFEYEEIQEFRSYIRDLYEKEFNKVSV